MDDFAAMIEARSRGSAVSCHGGRLLERLGCDVAAMRNAGHDPAVISAHETFNERLAPFLPILSLGGILPA